jgi:hypothetical protein
MATSRLVQFSEMRSGGDRVTPETVTRCWLSESIQWHSYADTMRRSFASALPHPESFRARWDSFGRIE